MYFCLVLLGIFIIFVVLTDLGPQHSRHPFWIRMQKIRSVMDHIFSVLFIVLVVGAIAAALIFGIYNWAIGGGRSAIVTGAILIVIIAICFFSLKSTRDSFRRGERCECCGDCSKCKIQCTSNEKYYGIMKNSRKHL